MRRFTRPVGVFALTLALTLGSSGCWLQPGFDSGRSHWNDLEIEITPANVDELVPVWHAPAGAPAVSYGGTVYAIDGMSLTAFAADTGTVRWTADVPKSVGYPGEIFFFGKAPAFTDGEVLVPWVVALLNGETDGGFARFDAGSGDYLGLAAPAGLPFGRPAVVDGALVPVLGRWVGSPGSQWVSSIPWTYTPALYADAGATLPGEWFAVVGERILWSRSTTAYGFSPACPKDPASPFPDWCVPDWSTDLGATPTGVAKVGTDQAVYVDDTGTVSVLDATTGTVVWTAAIGGTVFPPAVTDTTILVSNWDRVVALPAGGCGAATCAPLWEAPVSPAPGTGPQVSGTPAIGRDVAYVPTSTGLLAFAVDGCGAPTCKPLATIAAGDVGYYDPIVDDGRVIATTSVGEIRAFALPGAD